MAKHDRGEIVWAKAEKTVAGGFKPRPVLILAVWPCNGTFDYLVCVCSSSRLMDPYKTGLENADFEFGGFPVGEDTAFIRPTYTTTIPESDFLESVGKLTESKFNEVKAALAKALNLYGH